MTPAQLELKRWRELRNGARKARHLVHAMRTPLARLVRFERAALRAFNKQLEKLERVKGDSGFSAYEPSDHREMVTHLLELADQLEKDERKLTAKVEKLAAAKKTSAPLPPIENRIAKRRKAAQTERERRARADADKMAWLDRSRTVLAPMIAAAESAPMEVRSVLAAVAVSPRSNSALNRSTLRHYGYERWADELLALEKAQPM